MGFVLAGVALFSTATYGAGHDKIAMPAFYFAVKRNAPNAIQRR